MGVHRSDGISHVVVAHDGREFREVVMGDGRKALILLGSKKRPGSPPNCKVPFLNVKGAQERGLVIGIGINMC